MNQQEAQRAKKQAKTAPGACAPITASLKKETLPIPEQTVFSRFIRI